MNRPAVSTRDSTSAALNVYRADEMAETVGVIGLVVDRRSACGPS